MNKTANVAMSASGFNYITKSSYFESKHKSRPSHFSSVVEGRLKRTERKSLHRKSARISTFDNARNMSPQQSASPAALTAVQVKSQRRRLLLQQWKDEKERKKLEKAKVQKKKPFVVGTVHAPLAFELPPVAPKPSTSGRMTRSQSLRNKSQLMPIVTKKPPADSRQGRTLISAADFFAKLGKNSDPPLTSFAPPNAVFHPPKLEMNFMLPPVENSGKMRTTKQSVTFDPIVKTSHSAPVQKTVQKTNDRHKAQNVVKSAGRSSQPRASNQKAEANLESKAVRTQHVSVLAPKDNNNRSDRATRRNARLAENKKEVETKQTELKPQTKQKSKQVNEIVVRSHNTTKKRSTKVPKSESSVEEILRTPPQEQMSERSSISPCVTISRGKRNARKETIDKLKCGLLGDDVGDGKTVDDFRLQLNSEMKRLTAISDEWHQYAEDNILPEHIQELVLAAVGQTRLLMSKKLQQFSSLIELCATGQARAEGNVTISDLEGFWDMVFMQVENVDMRFKNLRELRERQWVTEEKPKKTKKPPAMKKKAAAEPGPGAPSKIRAMIEAARKAAMQKKNTNILLTCEPTDNKHFDAGFFCVKSPVRASTASTTTPRPNRSMLQDVLSSEARRATSVNQGSASRAMMKASYISKAMDEPISKTEISPRPSALEINLEATPGRSILKTPNVHAQRSSRKSAKIVLFHTEATERSPSPSAGIRQIAITPEKVEKSPLAPVSNKVVTRRQRSVQTPRREQENVAPSSESPPRRLTRNMRRSILQEKKDSTSLAELPVKTGRRGRTSAKNSIQLTEVH